jgi:hypothetical protein
MTDPERSDRKTAGQVRRSAQGRRESSKRQAAEAIRGRRSAAAKSAAQTEKVIEERARLDHLDAKADALGGEKAALGMADEAAPTDCGLEREG